MFFELVLGILAPLDGTSSLRSVLERLASPMERASARVIFPSRRVLAAYAVEFNSYYLLISLLENYFILE
jgi:hypothetical protein